MHAMEEFMQQRRDPWIEIGLTLEVGYVLYGSSREERGATPRVH